MKKDYLKNNGVEIGISAEDIIKEDLNAVIEIENTRKLNIQRGNR